MPTLMAVHAHPDDEGIQTGGTLALYAARGVVTVLVTCTNGDMGDSPDGLKPGTPGHDPEVTARMRLEELGAATRELGISHHERLGFRDSGMMGWPQNSAPDSFWNVPLEAATARIAELMGRHRPEVVVTYDERGLYGHPDHIQAHRATVAAAARTGIPQKLYEIAFPKSLMDGFAELQRQSGGGPGESDEASEVEIGIPDELITTTVDVSAVWERKRAAIFAHGSQLANFPFLKLDDGLLRAAMATEYYVRRFDRTGAALPETDLFSGVR